MQTRASLLSSWVLILPAILFLANAAVAQRQPLLTGPIDTSSVMVLRGSQPHLSHTIDLGPVDQTAALQRMVLVLNIAPEQQHQLATLLDGQHTKGTQSYHRWLTPQEFGRQFGPVQDDLEKITAWLQHQGFSINNVAASGMWVEFSGTVSQVNTTFHTQMRRYQVAGEQHIANATEISIPAALAPLVKGVPLHDFFSKPTLTHATQRPLPEITAKNGANAVTPGDFAAIYDLGALYKANVNGSGQTIAIVSRSDINLSDIAAFENLFGLPSNVPNVIDNGATPGVVPTGDGLEAALDVEWAIAVAPGAAIELVPSFDTTTTDGVALSASYIVDQNLAQIVNVSFGECEQDLGQAGNAFWSNLWQQAAAQGMSVFVSSGDTGASGCATTFPSPQQDFELAVNGVGSTPFSTTVGGTQFDETVNGGSASTFWSTTNGPNLASAIGYIPERVWNDESLALGEGGGIGGGGISTVYSTPSWQTLNVPGLQILQTFSLPGQTGVPPRGVPDVSLAAADFHDPYLFCFTSPFNLDTPDCQKQNSTVTVHAAGGTSFASPAFAGLMAIINQKIQSDDPGASVAGRQGLANYVLYPLAVAENFSACNSSNRTDPSMGAPAGCIFNDITIGNNTFPSASGYNTTLGYDLASGLGSVDANNLASAWNSAAATFHASETTLQTSPASSSISINHGQTITFSVSVQKMPGDSSTRPPAGAISLISQGGTLSGSVGVAAAPLSGSASPVTTGNFNVSNLPGGSYNLAANFPGDGFFAGSVSNTIPVTVAPEASTTTLFTPLPQFLTYGNQLELAVNVAGTSGQGVPSGQVTLTDGGTPFAQLKLDNVGIGSFNNCPPPGAIVNPTPSSLPCLTVGTHAITATYSGDGSFNPSPTPPAPSQSASLIIAKGVPVVQASADPSASGFTPLNTTLTTFLTAISPAAVQPTGTVQFQDGATVIGQAPVVTVGGIPQASIPATLSQGNHKITGVYSGDSLYASGILDPFTVSVGVPVGWSSNSTSQTINPGQTATYNLTLTAVPGFTGQAAITCVSGTDPNNPVPVPSGVQCSINTTSVNFTSTTTSVQVTATVNTTTQSRLAPPFLKLLPFVPAVALIMGSLRRHTKVRRRFLAVAFGIISVACLSSCGGGGQMSGNPTPTPTPTPSAANVVFTVWAATQDAQIPNQTDFNGIPLTVNINP